MPKNTASKTSKWGEAATIALFLAGCLAELFVLTVRRYYVNGTLRQVVAWDGYLPVIGTVGAVVLALGLVWLLARKKDRKQRIYGCAVAFAGGFVALVSFLAHWNQAVLTLFAVLVPICTLLAIFWVIYDRECSLSLTVLCAAIVMIWICEKTAFTAPYSTWSKVLAGICIVAAAGIAYLTKEKKLGKLLNPGADTLPVMISCGLAAAGLVVGMLSPVVAHYAMLCVALVAFGLVVYYTVKQL